MATRINVNVSGFDALRLKQRAEEIAAANRKLLDEKRRLNEASKNAEKKRVEELKVKGTAIGQVLGGKFVPPRKEEDFVGGTRKKSDVTACYINVPSQYTLEIQPRLSEELIVIDLMEGRPDIQEAANPYSGPIGEELVKDERLDNPYLGYEDVVEGNRVQEIIDTLGSGCGVNPFWSFMEGGVERDFYFRQVTGSYGGTDYRGPYFGYPLIWTLPYGNGKFVLAIFQWLVASRVTTFSELRQFTLWNLSPGGLTFVQGCGPSKFASIVRTDVESISSEIVIGGSQEYMSQKCYLVDDFTVREIGMPSKLRAAMIDWSSKNDYQLNYGTAPWFTVEVGTTTSYGPGSTIVDKQTVQVEAGFYNLSYTREPIDPPSGKFLGYGVSRYNTFQVSLATPSIYTPTKDAFLREELEGNPLIKTDNQAFLEYYLEKEPFRSRTAGTKFFAAKEFNQGVFYFGIVPESSESNAELPPPALNQRLLCKRQPNMIIWNWDDRAYCKRQLISLGFDPGIFV